jgi:putative membrane protein
MSSKDKTLILIVDRDDDIGQATGLETPIYGRDKILEAALEFGRKKPEDSDLNVIFAGIKLYDKLREEGNDVEIAIVGGHPYDSVKADMKLREEVQQLKDKLGVNSVIIMSDGADDEAVIPVVQSILPVTSVKRVVVEQWRGIEETYILIGKYIKKALLDPRFSKLFLGVPGLIILSLAALDILGYLRYATVITGILLGAAMFIRGFNLEEKIYEYWASSPIMFIASSLSTISLVIGVGILANILSSGLNIKNLGSAIVDSTPFFGMTAFSVLVGKSIIKLLQKDIRVWRDIIGMVITIISIIAFNQLGSALIKYSSIGGVTGIRIAFFESGFVEILLIGIGLSGVLMVIASILEKKKAGD